MTTLVAGHAALHDLIAVSDSAAPGSSIGTLSDGPGARGRWLPGGSAPTVALAMAVAGTPVALWHALPGADLDGPFLRLHSAGVDLSRCPRVDVAGYCVMIRAGDDVTAWSSQSGSPVSIDPATLDGIDHVVICPAWGPWCESMLAAAARAGVRRSLVGMLPEAALRHDWETVVISERQAPPGILDRVRAATVAVTRGARGGSVRHRDRWIEVAAVPVALVDATGAGDVYAGTILSALAAGSEVTQAADQAAAAAAACCAHWGAQTSLTTLTKGAHGDALSRARGALWGLACGDAFGMPGAFLPATRRRQLLGTITSLVDAPSESPYHAGYPAGRITDDTEQALALTQAYRADGILNPEQVARELDRWLEAAGGPDGLAVGPSTRRALIAWRAGVDVRQTGRSGTSNGGAMRITPVGIVHGLRGHLDLDPLIDDVGVACTPTHNTTVAISAASAVAAAVAAGVAGESWESVLAVGPAAALRSRHGFWVYAPSVAERIDLACRLAIGAETDAACLEAMSRLIGTGEPSAEAVPAAFGIAARANGDPAMAIRLAGNMEGDSDTIGAMAGAICGGFTGEQAIPEEWRQRVASVNALNVDRWADQLVQIARRAVVQEVR